MKSQEIQEDEYIVDKIVDKRYINKHLEYKIRWAGYGPDDDTWEPYENIQNLLDYIKEYEQRQNKVNKLNQVKSKSKISLNSSFSKENNDAIELSNEINSLSSHCNTMKINCNLKSSQLNSVCKAVQINVLQGAVVSKLERMGHRVGQAIIDRFTKDLPRFKDELDVMKFVCKEFWTSVFKKQVDNLRTNHQGIYVLSDRNFRLLTQLSNEEEYIKIAPKFIAFSCGLIRGALSNFGLICVVTAEVSSLPECRFTIDVKR